MADIKYITPADVIYLHAEVMDRTGYNPAPVRSQEALESAVMKPQMAAFYEEADLIRQATVLAVGLSQAQAFLDGNKRTGYAACDTFLRINGWQYTGEPVDFARQLEAVAERSDSLPQAADRFEAFLRGRVRRLLR
jgi:death-on-curing protein